MNGGKVYLHPTHFEEELKENLFFAKCLAEKGKIVYLMPFYHSFQMKNPDATINGRLIDFKYPKNNGWGIDLGGNYQLTEQLSVSASIVDLGYIKWKTNPHNIKSHISFVTNQWTYSGNCI